MTISFRTEVRLLDRSRTPNAATVILEKQTYDDDVLVGTQDHACCLIGDPADKATGAAFAEQLGALGDDTIGLAPLSAEQIDQIIQAHAAMWAPDQEAQPSSFADYVAKAIDTQPEFAGAKAALIQQQQGLASLKADVTAG